MHSLPGVLSTARNMNGLTSLPHGVSYNCRNFLGPTMWASGHLPHLSSNHFLLLSHSAFFPSSNTPAVSARDLPPYMLAWLLPLLKCPLLREVFTSPPYTSFLASMVPSFLMKYLAIFYLSLSSLEEKTNVFSLQRASLLISISVSPKNMSPRSAQNGVNKPLRRQSFKKKKRRQSMNKMKKQWGKG